MPVIMPRSLINGNEALRMLDYFKYPTRKASLLFAAAHQFGVDDEGKEIFSMLDSHFEVLLILERRNMLTSDSWKEVIKDADFAIKELLKRLEQRLTPGAPPPRFRITRKSAA